MNFLFNGEVVDYDYYKSNNDYDLLTTNIRTTTKENHYDKSNDACGLSITNTHCSANDHHYDQSNNHSLTKVSKNSNRFHYNKSNNDNIKVSENFCKFHYDKSNNASVETILFLHGWGGNKNSFIQTINLLKQKFNIFAIALPTILKTNMAWNNELYCELVYSILRAHNIDKVIVICHSFGFRIACLLKEKINITKIVVTGGAGLKKTNIFKKIEQNNNKILLANKKFKYLYNSLASTDYKNLPNTNKQTFKKVVNTNYKNLIKFNCPMLLFWGKKDCETKLWIAKKLKQQNNAKLIVTESDHFAYLKQSALFNNAVLKFLK